MEPDRLAQLSRRYARYSRSLPGLSLALGGLVMLLLLLAPPLIQNDIQVCWENQRALLGLGVAVLLSGWILTKEWLRRRIYQSFGLAEGANSSRERLFNGLLAFALGLLALAYLIRWLAVKPHPAPDPTPVQVYLGLTACFTLPWATLRFIRGVMEGALWFLLCFWGLALIWVFPLWEGLRQGDPLAAVFYAAIPLAYLGGLAVGLVQHINFMRLAREIRAQEPGDE